MKIASFTTVFGVEAYKYETEICKNKELGIKAILAVKIIKRESNRAQRSR